MKKIYIYFVAALFASTISLLLIPGFSPKRTATYEKKESSEEENDAYDSPDKAAEFEIRRTKDPATGKVPTDKMWAAVLQTKAIKNANTNSHSANALTPLTWTERGSYIDAVGPSNGNQRPGNGVTSGRIRAIWVDKADASGKTVWVGGVDGGLWKTTDVTATTPAWTLVNDYLSNLAITGICQDPTNSNTMYFCTGEAYLAASTVNGNGVFKSTDHGVTWALLPSTSTLVKCTRILCDATGNVYVSTMGISVAVGLQRSIDGGASWTNINPFTTTSRIVDFEISSTGTMHISAGINSAPGIGGYRYTNNPATATTSTGWNTPITPFIFPEGANGYARTELAVSGNTVYAALAHPASGSSKIDSIAKSTDGGVNWVTVGLTTQNITDLNGSTGLGWFAMGLAIDPSDPNTLIVGSLRLLKSTDGGVTFSKISEWVGTTGQYVHADQHNITWYDNGNKLLVGCDGGLFFSNDKGSTISDKNTGLRLKQFYGVAMHPTATNYFLCGSQDNGTHQFNGPGLTSSIEVLGGDGGITAIDQNEPLFQTGAYVYSNFRRSTDGGSTWSSSGSSSSDGQFINPYDYDNVNNRVYAGYSKGNYLRWEDPHSGFTFTPVAIADFGTNEVTSVSVSPYTSNRVYFGTSPTQTGQAAKLFKVDNADQATPTVTDITPTGIAAGYVNSINVGSNDQNLIATLSNYGTLTNIWSSTNGGANWVACDGNLPDMPVYWALFHPDGDTKAYIATETGIWSTDLLNGTGTIWSPESTFPTVKTVMLKYRTSDRTLAAATYGRGLWTSKVPVPNCTAASITTQPTSTGVCTGNNVSFSIVTAGSAPLTYQWQVSIDGGTTWSNVSNDGVYSNAITATLTITGATALMNNYRYRVIVTGNCAPLTVTSSAATLTVNPATVIISQPANSVVCASASTSFSVLVTGSSLTYQWQESTNGGAAWNNIINGGIYSGVTTATLTLSGVTANLNNNQYRVIISSSCTALNSNAVTLTVNTAPSITSQPVAASVCAGNTATFSVTAIGTGLTYQWQENISGTWVNITNGGIYSGATSATLTITGTTIAMNNYQYRSIITGTCAPAATSNAAVLSVGTALAITSQPVASTVCAGANTTFSVSTTGTVISYQWQENINGTWTNITNAGIYSGASSTTLTLTGVTAIMNGYQYRAVVTGSCPAINSNAALLIVNTAPAVTTAPTNATVCIGGTAIFNVVATGTSLTYQWQENVSGTWANVTNGGIYSGATTATLSITNTTLTMDNFQYRSIVSGTCSPPATSNGAMLFVNTPISIVTSPSNATICATGTVSFSVVANGTSPIYQWQENANGSWVNINNAGIYTNATTATLTLVGVTRSMNNYQYRAVVSSVACASVTSNSTALTVSAQPTITLTASPTTMLVPGRTTTITASVTPATGFSIAWTRNGHFTTATNNSIVVGVDSIGLYTAVATIGSCVSIPASITVSDSASNNLFIYPIPNNGKFTVAYNNPGGAATTQVLTIYNGYGSRVYTKSYAISQAYQLLDVDMRKNAAGVYYIVLGDANGKKVKVGTVIIR